ncbi:MAG: TerC family protein [Bacteroidota bacterium]
MLASSLAAPSLAAPSLAAPSLAAAPLLLGAQPLAVATAHIEVSWLIWVGFNALVVGLLLLDLLGFNRTAHKIELREAAALSAFFVAVALVLNAALWVAYGTDVGLTFLTAYVVEKSLSVDNLFVIAVLFRYFQVPPHYQHRVLFWGIFGAIVMRGAMILVGVKLVAQFHWVLNLFGAFLVLTGLKMLRGEDEDADPGDNRILQALRRVLPLTKTYYGERFVIRRFGRTLVTPLFLVLVMIELTDVVFAFDSIPAILGITTDPFLAYSSNIMAVLGLRALYFLLAGVIEQVRYLHIGLSLTLVFIGAKMLAIDVVHVPTPVSLGVIVLLIGGSALVSVWANRRDASVKAAIEPAEWGEERVEEDDRLEVSDRVEVNDRAEAGDVSGVSEAVREPEDLEGVTAVR